MSINFDRPLTPEQQALVKELFGEPVAADDRQFLYEPMKEIDSAKMKKLANATKQPATFEIHGDGEIKTLANGTRYQVTPTGWRRLDDNA